MILNFTPHTINLDSGESFPSNGVARCAVTREVVEHVTGTGTPIPVFRATFGAVEGLPAPELDTILIVSMLVAQACPDRSDLVFPGELIRDAEGKPLCCKGFSVI